MCVHVCVMDILVVELGAGESCQERAIHELRTREAVDEW